jgi:hypothetical protein
MSTKKWNGNGHKTVKAGKANTNEPVSVPCEALAVHAPFAQSAPQIFTTHSTREFQILVASLTTREHHIDYEKCHLRHNESSTYIEAG